MKIDFKSQGAVFSMGEFSDKVVLITGAGRGIGRELALGFGSLGGAVAANDINPLCLDETVNLVQQGGGIARPYVFDIAKKMPIEGMLAQVQEHFKRIDVLVNHAAVRPDDGLLEMDEWEFHRTLDVNLGGPYFAIQQVGRMMREQGGGSIINLLYIPRNMHFTKGHTALSASLAGLLGLTQAAASELAPYHVRVNAVCYNLPFMDTYPTTGSDMPNLQVWSDAHPQLRTGDHPEIDRLVLFLCSHEAAGVTGQIFTVRVGDQA